MNDKRGREGAAGAEGRKKTLSYVPPPPSRLILSRARCSISSPVLTRDTYYVASAASVTVPPALVDNVHRRSRYRLIALPPSAPPLSRS